jgi:hypothetical protein
MRNANRLLLLLAAAAALGACNPAAPERNTAAANAIAPPPDIETLPADESSATPSNELQNGADNPDVNETANVATH